MKVEKTIKLQRKGTEHIAKQENKVTMILADRCQELTERFGLNSVEHIASILKISRQKAQEVLHLTTIDIDKRRK